MRIDQATYEACALAVPTVCRGVTWPADCGVTVDSAAACIAALRNSERLGTPNGDIEECSDDSLCE